VLSAVTTSLLVCFVKLFIWYVAVCCLCVCVRARCTSLWDVWLYRINNLTKQTSREVVTAQHEDGQTIVTETCRVLMMCFTNIFNNLMF
jgi:hypothetical protein